MMEIKVDGMLPFKIRDDAELTIFENINARNIHIGRVVRKRAADLKEKHKGKCGDYLVFPILEGQYDDKYIHFERKLKNKRGARNQFGVYRDTIDLELGEDEAYILGLYTAEGSRGDWDITFTFNIDETNLRDKVIEFAGKYGYHCRVYYRQEHNAMDVVITGVLLADLFESLCGKGAENKHIPQIILLHKNKKLLEAYLQGYFDGDGSIVKLQNKWERQGFNTISKLLALQIQLAGMRLGKYFGITYHKAYTYILGGKEIHHRDSYFGYMFKNTKSIFSTDGRNIYIPIRSIRKLEGEL